VTTSDEPAGLDPDRGPGVDEYGEHLRRPEPIDPDVVGVGRPGGPSEGRVILAVAAGGLLGAPARYGIGLGLPVHSGGFPLGTFLINVSGSLALAALVTLVIERWPPTRYVRPFFGTGFLGAYTTWSTFVVDTTVLAKDGHVAVAVAYVAASLVTGFAAVFAGVVLVRRRPRPVRAAA
jgi:fluoride exporter